MGLDRLLALIVLEVTGVDSDDIQAGVDDETLPRPAAFDERVVLHGHVEQRRGDLPEPGDLRLMLAHYPSWISTAADLGVHLLFAGHTHGGQIRLPNGRALTNACDLPLGMSCGVLRHRDTLVAISRGLGEVGFFFNTFRAFCPAHVPVYTLRRGPTLGQSTPRVVKVLRW